MERTHRPSAEIAVPLLFEFEKEFFGQLECGPLPLAVSVSI
jgi:hypothetical protein